MSVLITGGGGLVGIHVAKALGSLGERVICVDVNPLPPHAAYILDGVADQVTYIRGDILERGFVAETIDRNRIEGVVHAAAIVNERVFREDPARGFETNCVGTLNVLEAARQLGLRRVVYASSATVYGPRASSSPIPEEQPTPESLYAESKYIGERLLERYRSVYRIDALIVRISTAYGPGKPWKPERYPLQRLLWEAMRGNHFRMAEGGDYLRDFTFISDTALGVCLAYRAVSPGHSIYNIASGASHTLAEVASVLNALFPSADIEIGPGRFENDFALAGSLRGPLDIRRAAEDLGFRPRFGLKKGLEAYATFLRQHPPQ